MNAIICCNWIEFNDTRWLNLSIVNEFFSFVDTINIHQNGSSLPFIYYTHSKIDWFNFIRQRIRGNFMRTRLVNLIYCDIQNIIFIHFYWGERLCCTVYTSTRCKGVFKKRKTRMNSFGSSIPKIFITRDTNSSSFFLNAKKEKKKKKKLPFFRSILSIDMPNLTLQLNWCVCCMCVSVSVCIFFLSANDDNTIYLKASIRQMRWTIHKHTSDAYSEKWRKNS